VIGAIKEFCRAIAWACLLRSERLQRRADIWRNRSKRWDQRKRRVGVTGTPPAPRRPFVRNTIHQRQWRGQ
jgi:hypothetical protein